MDHSGENPFLPFDLSGHPRQTESVGTNVFLPAQKEKPVVKIGKQKVPAKPVQEALNKTLEFRRLEEIAREIASPHSQKAIVPQEYVLAQGTEPESSHIVRTQKFVKGVPLKNLGFQGILSLDQNNLDTLRSLCLDSLRCFIKTGVFYDLIGSDAEDSKSRTLSQRAKRIIFPLRNSYNLFLAPEGIKLVDPNVFRLFPNRSPLRRLLVQAAMGVSLLSNYFLLTAVKPFRKKRSEMATPIANSGPLPEY